MSDRLAIEGGRPVRDTVLPYARHLIDEDDIEAVVEALRSGWLTTGPYVERLEKAFAERVGTRHAVAFSSGTAALHGCAFAAGVGPGDEVVVPTMTFAASAACAIYVGATPVLADVDSRTLNLDPVDLEQRITKRTRAVVAVHYAGIPADMGAISEIARRHGLVLIEDAAHAAGAETPQGLCGALGDMGAFSLHPAKQLTAGEGGVVTTDRHDYAQRLRRFRTHCMDVSARDRQAGGMHAYAIEELGFNYRLTDFQAALAVSQLGKLDGFVARRTELARAYGARLSVRPELTLPHVPPGMAPGWHLYVVRLNLDRLSADRDMVFKALHAEGIGVNVHYIPIHMLGFYARLLGHRPGDLPVAEDAYLRLITLPLFAAMTDDDLDSVVNALDKVLNHYTQARPAAA